MGPGLKSVFYTQTPLEKTNFSFVSGYQLEIGYGLRILVYVHFSECWDPTRPIPEHVVPEHGAMVSVSSDGFCSGCL